MRAIVQTRYGDPHHVLTLTDIPRPTPGPGEALIRVRASSVNTPDWLTVTGTPRVLRLTSGLRRPTGPIRGSDLAGTIEATGDDVTDLRPGDDVYGSLWNATLKTPHGAFAEYTIARTTHLTRKPAHLTFEQAAASVMSGLTALTAIRDIAAVTPGTHVLINGASGGVGTFAVQIAKHLGAHVTAVCGTRNHHLVTTLGADHTIDYTTEDFTTHHARYDVILDNVLNHPPTRTIRALTPGGILMPNSIGDTTRPFAGLPRIARAQLIRRSRADIRSVDTVFDRAHLDDLATLLTDGTIIPVLDTTYPLEQTPAAIAHMLTHRARGNIAITV